MSKPRGEGGYVVRSKAGVSEMGWCGGVGWAWDRSWVGMGVGTEGVVVFSGVGGLTLHTTSGSSVCGQGGCQALGLWIAGDC